MEWWRLESALTLRGEWGSSHTYGAPINDLAGPMTADPCEAQSVSGAPFTWQRCMCVCVKNTVHPGGTTFGQKAAKAQWAPAKKSVIFFWILPRWNKEQKEGRERISGRCNWLTKKKKLSKGMEVRENWEMNKKVEEEKLWEKVEKTSSNGISDSG